MPEAPRRFVPKPDWVVAFESSLAQRIPVHPNWISAAKLLLITPVFYLALSGRVPQLTAPWTLALAFLCFAALDYLDGVVARGKGLDTSFGRVFDRLTDYPLLLICSYYSLDVVPRAALFTKLGCDALLLLLFILGRGSTENRLRTTMSYAALLGLLFASRNWLPTVFTPTFVGGLLWLSAVFSALVVLYNLRVLQKRFIADALSAMNLACGIWSIVLASDDHFFSSLVLLIVGAAFDGFDGAAARRWGGTRFGVYSDDIADGINYGIAPGAAVYFATSSLEGALLGGFFATFTIGRLVYFTLNKTNADPNYFSGVPSTSGGLITLCGVILFHDNLLLLGAMVGVACSLMVSFASRYRHPGRAAGKYPRRALLLAPLCLLLVTLGAIVGGPRVAASLILTLNLLYGFWPTVRAFRTALGARKQSAS